MRIEKTPIADLLVVEPDVFGDDRGAFSESYNEEKFAALGLPNVWRQDSHSESVRGVLRGLHFQLPPKPMTKLVRCAKGRVWNVAVDLRKESPTYKQSFGIELSAENRKMLLIPDGCANGFYLFGRRDLPLQDLKHVRKRTGREHRMERRRTERAVATRGRANLVGA